MLAFGYIYIMIFCMGIISALIYGSIYDNKKIIVNCAKFCVIYYYNICVFRTLVGNGAQYLGTSFADKTIRAYLKVGMLGIVVFLLLLFFLKLTKDRGQEYIQLVVGIFVALSLLYTVLIDLPRMIVTVILGILAMVISGLLILVFKDTKWSQIPKKGEDNDNSRYIEIGIPVLLFCTLFFLTGPLELFAYNMNDFVFNLNEFIPYMLFYAFALMVVSIIILGTFVPQWIFSFTKKCIFLYCICSYFQQMFLNGNMNKMEGNEQHWNIVENIGNATIWLIIIALLLLILHKAKKEDLIISYVSAFVAGIQIITFMVVLLTSTVSGSEKRHLVENSNFNLSENENLVIFILDAYDTQMLDKVLAQEPNYLEPLHDFMYFNNMTSRYAVTDSSLPYLLTGRIAEEEETYSDIYRKSTFLNDIKGYGYEINVLTADYYIEPFEQGIVNNITEDYYCTLEFEKTVSQMSKCVRYRSAPFVIKQYYYYEYYDLTNVIYDTDVYLFGTDPDFYSDLCEMGVTIDAQMSHTMHIYHLYGAHAPYYLSEEATLDFDSNPIAQWKGCLKIVYEYLEQLKAKDLYDKTSVIIMADHGLNRSQRGAMEDWNISVTDESNPIFFIKGKNQKQEQLSIRDDEVSHDDFFGTVIKLIDEKNNKYGNAVWE